MRIDVMPVYGRILSSHISGCTVIVVDVLRSSTSIIMAAQHGAGRIIPASDPGEAAAIAGRLGLSDCVLAGERGGVQLPGFSIGNSPDEFSAARVAGKTVIISTSNGTAAIHGVRSAKNVLIGAMVNCEAVAKKAVEIGDDIIIVCAGTDGNIGADDLCAAGAVAEAIRSNAKTEIAATDITLVCCMLYADWKSGRADLSVSKHYGHLLELGFEADVNFCFTENITTTVPVYENGIIK